MMRPAAAAVLLLAIPCMVSAAEPPRKASASHKSGICGEIKKVDLLLYDSPRNHAPTTTCSYTDARLLIKPAAELPPDRMKRFTLLAFAAVGGLRNEDFFLPDKTYVGYGTQCRVMLTNDAAAMQSALRTTPGQAGLLEAMMTTESAAKAPCPK